jgi:hypothetical protein
MLSGVDSEPEVRAITEASPKITEFQGKLGTDLSRGGDEVK